MRRRGLMLVLSSPSGAGKSTLTRNLVERAQIGALSVSVTTRPRRPPRSRACITFHRRCDEFEAMRDRGDLLEWAEVHGNFYGTPREPVEQALAAGRDMLFDIDWQGTRQVDEKMRGRHRHHLHPAAVDGGTEGAAGAPRRGSAGDDRQAPGQRPRRDRALERIRLRARQRRPRPRLRRAEGDPRGRAPEARAPRRPVRLRRKASREGGSAQTPSPGRASRFTHCVAGP